MEAEIKEEVEEYGLTLNTPDEIKEIKNIGLSVKTEWGDWWSLLLAADYQDLDKQYGPSEFVTSWELGFHVPKENYAFNCAYTKKRGFLYSCRSA